MALSWINFSNGDLRQTIRTALNAFNTATTTAVNLNTDNTATNTADLVSLKAGTQALVKSLYTPQVTAPAYAKANVYFNDNTGTLDVQGKYTDVTTQLGREMHIEVINNTGATIPNGTAVRHDGVTVGGVVQVVPALADTFVNSQVLGITTHTILNTAVGLITTQGVVGDLNTTGYPTGVPLYLSATVPGTYTEVIPAIVSQIGGSLTSNISTGEILIVINNNIAVPTIIGIMGGQALGVSDTYPLTATPVVVNDYTTDSGVVVLRDKLNGTLTVANAGTYRASFSASLTFASIASTRSVTFDLYDVTTSTIMFSYVKSIPRDSAAEALSFSGPFAGLLNNVYEVRVSSADNFTITIGSVSFDIVSISLQ